MNLSNPAQAESTSYFKNLSRREYISKVWEIIQNEGSDAVSVRRLAQEFSCSSTALYRHFKNLDELLFYAYLNSLNAYIESLVELCGHCNDAWEMHLGIWELYAGQAFRFPDAFDLIFFQSPEKNVGCALAEFYSMYPDEIILTPPIIQKMLKTPDFFQRDFIILEKLVEQGQLSLPAAQKINHLECMLYMGYFKHVLDRRPPESEIPHLVSTFIGELKDIITLCLKNL